MSDEGFHEIQLNSKQLIFLCMTAALVLVVAFLSGVLVGRGVRTEKDTAAADTAAAAAVQSADPAAAGAPAPQEAAPPAIAPPTPVDEDLTYAKRLEGEQPPQETLPPAAEPPASRAPAKAGAKDAPAEAAKPAPPGKAPAPKEAKSSSSDAARAASDAPLPAEPAGSGFYLRIAAFRDRGQAEGLSRRLSGKGYGSYVIRTGKGPVLYSVRVGKYKTRREADSIRRRLEKEEQLKPLISH